MYLGTVLTTDYPSAQNDIDAKTLQGHLGRIYTAMEMLQESATTMTHNTSAANRAARDGVEVSESSQQIIGQLRASQVHVGRLVSVVAATARQTSLLALTAAIEATHAGKDFAAFGVIADEIDSLAKRTARASDEMHQRAAELQEASEAAAAALLRGDGVLRELDAYQDEISTAVQTQNAAAASVATGIVEVARSTGDIVTDATRAPEDSPPTPKTVPRHQA